MGKKQEWKRQQKKCFFCEEMDLDLLDVHRIVPGAEGGKYTHYNSLVCCCKCHRKIHSGKIEVVGKFMSTAGRVLIYRENGEEKVEKI